MNIFTAFNVFEQLELFEDINVFDKLKFKGGYYSLDSPLGMFSAFSYFGGKHVQMPDIMPYLDALADLNNSDILFEGFGGGGRLVLNQNLMEHKFEVAVYNELNPYVYSLMTILSREDTAKELQDMLALADYDKYMYDYIKFRQYAESHGAYRHDMLTKAMFAFIKVSCSRGGVDKYDPHRNLTEEEKRAFYERRVQRLSDVSGHLGNVCTCNYDYREIMKYYGKEPRILKYLDPPYHPATRFGGDKDMENASKRVGYDFDFSRDNHLEMVEILNDSRNWVMSGYDPLENGNTDYVSLEKHGARKILLGSYWVPMCSQKKVYKNEYIWIKI